MRELKWGETPWDAMSRDELLREVQRMYAALGSLGNVARMTKHANPDSPYWGKDGSGGRAIEMERQIAASLSEYDGEDMYRSFFRYAYDLLFDQSNGYRLGFGWVICPECGQMVGSTYKGDGVYVSNAGQPCAKHGIGKPDCVGILRPIEWSDLAPSQEPR